MGRRAGERAVQENERPGREAVGQSEAEEAGVTLGGYAERVSLARPHRMFCFKVSYRRLIWPDDGRIADDNVNKVTIFDGRMAISYSGLSKVLIEKTDEWLVRILTKPPIRSLAEAVYTIRDRATRAFRGWARRPSDKARHYLVFGFIGWTRQSDREDLQVVVGFVSNCHDEHAEIRDAREDFRVHHKILARTLSWAEPG